MTKDELIRMEGSFKAAFLDGSGNRLVPGVQVVSEDRL